MFSVEYHRAVAILNSQVKRDWELESACRLVRKSLEARDFHSMNFAEANLRDILRRRF